MKKALLVILALLVAFAVIFIVFWQLSIDRSPAPDNANTNNVVNVSNQENANASNQQQTSTSTTTGTVAPDSIPNTTSENTSSTPSEPAGSDGATPTAPQTQDSVQTDMSAFANAMQIDDATQTRIDAAIAERYASDTNLVTKMLQGKHFVNQNGQILKNVELQENLGSSDGVDWYVMKAVYQVPNSTSADIVLSYRVGATPNGLVSVEPIR